MSIKIILADDHDIMRAGLRSLLEKRPELEIVADASNGRDCVRLAKKLLPHVVVMDITMKDMNGVEATGQIIRSAPGVKVIALSMHAERTYIMKMLKAGASGYLLKDCSVDMLLDGIKTVHEGKIFLSPAISDVIVRDYVNKASLPEPVLTGREREVLQLLAEGNSVRGIAAMLFISAKTVETHRQKIMDKLGIRTIAELTKYAIREGVTSL